MRQYINLLPQSLIVDPFLIPIDQDDVGQGYLPDVEVEVERKIDDTIITGNTTPLRPNSGEPIMIRGHDIPVGYHVERGSSYRVWEWHGHIMNYDEINGFLLDYILGYYYERIAERNG